MTLQELIDELQDIKDRGVDADIRVRVYHHDSDFGSGLQDIDRIYILDEFGMEALVITA